LKCEQHHETLRFMVCGEHFGVVMLNDYEILADTGCI
jgi:hypothetical protein